MQKIPTPVRRLAQSYTCVSHKGQLLKQLFRQIKNPSPLLHTLIVIGNNTLTHFIKFADKEIQYVPVWQILGRDKIKKSDKKITRAIDAKMNNFDGDEEGQEYHVLSMYVWELESQISELELEKEKSCLVDKIEEWGKKNQRT